MTERLSQKELESYLWGAATLLRGLIDASDYKQYIFPLLFFKRLSEVVYEREASEGTVVVSEWKSFNPFLIVQSQRDLDLLIHEF